MAAQTTSTAHTSVLGKLLRTRGIVIYLAIVVASPFYLAQFISASYNRINAPIIDVRPWLLKDGVFLDNDKWPTLKDSDRLVAVNGIPVWRGNFNTVLNHQVEPGPVEVTVERDGRPFVAQGTAKPTGTLLSVAIIGRVIEVIIVLLIGLVGFALRPRGRVSWHLLAFCTMLAIFLSSGLAWDEWVVPRMLGARLGGAYFTAVGLQLFLEFPERLPWLRRNPVRARWLYVLPIALTPALYFSYSRQMIDVARPITQVIELWIGVGVLTMFGLMFRQLKLAKVTGNVANVSRVRVLLLGTAVGALVPAIWNVLHLVFYIGVVPGVEFFKALPVTIFVVLLAYAMLRHNALEIDRFTRAAVGYGAAVFILAAAAGLVFIGLPLILEGAGVVHSPTVLVAMTGVAGLALQPLYRRLKRNVDRWFFRDTGDEATRASLLSAISRTIQRGSRQLAVKEAIAAAMTVKPDRAELWMLDDSGGHFSITTAQGEVSRVRSIARNSPLGEALARRGNITETSPTETVVTSDALWELGLAMALPVGAEGSTRGFLAIGRKKSGTDYTSEELAFLEAVAAQIGLALETERREDIGRYRIERRLGVGGMAEVFLAWQLGPGGFERKVAIKTPLPHYAEDPEAVKMFLDEARISAQLRHRNIMQVYEVDQANGAYYMAMEFVDGPSLRTLLKRAAITGVPIPLPIIVQIVDSILSALSYAHDTVDAKGKKMRLVHRDVTPGNILLGRDGVAKLVDFGIARASEKLHVTRTGVAKGTVVYMSPEQAQGESVDNRADLYSLGVVLYGMLTGIRAFPNGRLNVKLPPRPEGLSQGLYDVCACAMQYGRDQRYRTAQDMRDALKAASRGIAPATDTDVAKWLAATSGPLDEQGLPVSDAATSVERPKARASEAPPPVTSTITVEGGAGDDDDTEITLAKAKDHSEF